MAVCKITLGGLGWVLVYDNKTTKTWNRPFGGPASAHLLSLIEPRRNKLSPASRVTLQIYGRIQHRILLRPTQRQSHTVERCGETSVLLDLIAVNNRKQNTLSSPAQSLQIGTAVFVVFSRASEARNLLFRASHKASGLALCRG